MHLKTIALWEARSGGPGWSIVISVFSVQLYMFYLLRFLSLTDKLPENKCLLFLFNCFFPDKTSGFSKCTLCVEPTLSWIPVKFLLMCFFFLLSVLLENCYFVNLIFYCCDKSIHWFGNIKIYCFIPVQNEHIKKHIKRHAWKRNSYFWLNLV